MITTGHPTGEFEEGPALARPGPKPTSHTERLDTSVRPEVMAALRAMAVVTDTTPTEVARRLLEEHLTGCLAVVMKEDA